MLDVIFNLYKIKFKILENLIKDGCKELTKSSKVNLYINLDNIMNDLCTKQVEEELQMVSDKKKSYMMISNIINLASHYRLFFSKNRIYAKVYIYTTYPFNITPKNRVYYEDYRLNYLSKLNANPEYYYIHKAFEESWELIKLICEYITGVYCIESRNIENSLIPGIVNPDKEGVNFIITKDPYDFQYVNEGFYILRPKKDDSKIITKDNLWEYFDIDTKINTSFYPFALSVTGDKLRSLPKIKGIGLKTIVKLIEKSIEKKIITDDLSNVGSLFGLIKNDYIEMVLGNYNSVYLNFQLTNVFLNQRTMIMKQLVDRFDNVGLKEITNQYFGEYPINISEITEANNLLRSNIKVR